MPLSVLLNVIPSDAIDTLGLVPVVTKELALILANVLSPVIV